MKTLDRLIALLEMREAVYRHDLHALAYTARAEHVPARSFAKVVIVHSEDGYAFTVLPADRIVDLEELRASFGNGTLFDYPVWVDGLLMSEETISFNAGTHRDVVQMNTEDWEQIVKPSVLAFAHAAQ